MILYKTMYIIKIFIDVIHYKIDDNLYDKYKLITIFKYCAFVKKLKKVQNLYIYIYIKLNLFR